jgi:hypothetical protein
MKKFQLLGLVLVAIFAFGAVSAVTASAVEFLLAEWLVSGSPVSSVLLADVEGELALSETIPIINVKISALCSGTLDGTIGLTGEDTITELLTLGTTGTLVSSTPLVEPGLLCTNTENCPEPLAWADNLPWNTLLELMVDGTETFFVDLLTAASGNVGYHVVCMGSTGLEDLCQSAEAGAKATNTAEGLDLEFSEAFNALAGFKLANCEKAGAEAGTVEGLGFILLTGSMEPVTASSEG